MRALSSRGGEGERNHGERRLGKFVGSHGSVRHSQPGDLVLLLFCSGSGDRAGDDFSSRRLAKGARPRQADSVRGPAKFANNTWGLPSTRAIDVASRGEASTRTAASAFKLCRNSRSPIGRGSVEVLLQGSAVILAGALAGSDHVCGVSKPGGIFPGKQQNFVCCHVGTQ